MSSVDVSVCLRLSVSLSLSLVFGPGFVAHSDFEESVLFDSGCFVYLS